MKLKVSIIDGSTALSLWNGKEKVGEASISQNRRVSSEFLPKLDKMLKKSGTDLKDIKKIDISSNISSSLTTGRIISAIKNILEFSRKNLEKNCG